MAGSCDPVLDGDRRCPGLCQLNFLFPREFLGSAQGPLRPWWCAQGAERNLSSSKFSPDLGPELALILVVVVVVVVCVCSSGSLFVR